MNTRVLLGVLGAVLAALACFAFSEEEPVTPPAAQGSPEPLPRVHPEPSPLPQPSRGADERDAGPALGLLTIKLERDGKPEVGPRLVLRNREGVEVSGTTDVMGQASFELARGPWLVMSPEPLAGERVEVTVEPARVTLTLPSPRRVEGRVLDEAGDPAAGALLARLEPQVSPGDRFSLLALAEPSEHGNARSSGLDEDEPGEELARTDAEGRFAFETLEETLVLRATRGEGRAVLETATPARGLTLRLEEVASLTVRAPSRTQAIVSLLFPKGRMVRQLAGEVQLRVPVGTLQARALTVERGKLLRASHELVVKAGAKNELLLVFSEAPPVSGVVLDARGAPVPGVTVGLSLAPSNPGTPPRSQDRAVTDARGRFELVPRLIRGGDPLYEVHLLPPWKEKTVPQVRLGDPPVTVEAN